MSNFGEEDKATKLIHIHTQSENGDGFSLSTIVSKLQTK